MINMSRHLKSSKGFTLMEVLVAILIFVVSALVFIDLTRGASRATKDTREISTATWLLQNAMTELETKLETEGFDKGCDKKKEGKFNAPYEKFTWVSYCTEIDFKISQTAAQVAAAQGEDSDSEPKKEDQVLKMILENASTYLTKSMREIHVQVNWTSGKKKRSVDATTHIARYDQPVTMPALSLGGS
jgi:prepilin-type N-terminal cleavage/methylation domain-containing protein